MHGTVVLYFMELNSSYYSSMVEEKLFQKQDTTFQFSKVNPRVSIIGGISLKT